MKAYLADKNTHVVILLINVKTDGYLTALAEVNKICKEQHPELYVAKIEQ